VNRTRVERLVHRYINDERTSRGLSALSYDTGLQEIARYHSRDMATNGYFAHTSPDGETMSDRYATFGYQCRVPTGTGTYYTGGENIAQTWFDTDVQTGSGIVHYRNESQLAHGLVTQWMNSPEHRDNLLLQYWNNEGIGVYVTDNGKVYATQDFC